jgi:hypothetical protein
MATSNGSLRMSKKGQTRGNGQIDAPGCHIANTRWWPPFCAASAGSPPPFSPPRSLPEPDFITSHATGQRQTRVDFETGI